MYITLPGIVGYIISFLGTAWHIWRGRFAICRQKRKRRKLAALTTLGSLHTAVLIICVAYTWSVIFFPESDAVIVRLGAVSSTSLKIWARHPRATQLHIQWAAEGRGDLAGGRLGPISVADAAEDFTATAEIEGLLADTAYQYSVFFTLRDMHTTSVVQRGRFETLPTLSANASFRFAVGSCIMKSERSSTQLEGMQRLQALSPRFWIGLGDYVYSDVPLTGGMGASVDHYRAHYRRTMADSHMKQVQLNYPAFHQVVTPTLLNCFGFFAHPSNHKNTHTPQILFHPTCALRCHTWQLTA